MHDELIRASVAVPVASLLGLAIVKPSGGGRLRASLVAGLLVLLALAPYADEGSAWPAILLAALAAALMPRGGPQQRLPWWVATGWVALVTAGATALAVLAIDWGTAEAAVSSVAGASSVVLVTAGLLVAVFVGGEAIARVLHPFAERIGDRTPGLENAGKLIGWLERTLLYVLVLAGAPDAAALVVAAKSVARFPAFSEETFAEYYLIGSLLSLVVAAGIAVAIRATLGLAAVPRP